MILHWLGMGYWFALVAWASGAVGRILKMAWKTMPAALLPALVMASAYLMIFVDLLFHAQTPVADDAVIALWGIAMGGAAVGFHELGKKAMQSVFGFFLGPSIAEHLAEIILGKLEQKAEKFDPTPLPKTKPTSVLPGTILCAALALGSFGCVGGAPPALPPEVQAAEDIALDVNALLPKLAQAMDDEGVKAIAGAETAEEARAFLEAVSKSWAPIWEGVEALETTYNEVRDALLRGEFPIEMVRGLLGRYCEVRALALGKGVELPAIPAVECP